MPRDGTYDPATQEWCFGGKWYSDNRDLEIAEATQDSICKEKWNLEKERLLNMEFDNAVESNDIKA